MKHKSRKSQPTQANLLGLFTCFFSNFLFPDHTLPLGAKSHPPSSPAQLCCCCCFFFQYCYTPSPPVMEVSLLSAIFSPPQCESLVSQPLFTQVTDETGDAHMNFVSWQEPGLTRKLSFSCAKLVERCRQSVAKQHVGCTAEKTADSQSCF